jgi:acyl-CoA synthetase (AMP-forming)/AMP-acid ligase II
MNPNLAKMLVRTARAYPDQAALYLGTEPLCTFEQLADRVARCACGLRDWLGLHAGDRVALIMKNCGSVAVRERGRGDSRWHN